MVYGWCMHVSLASIDKLLTFSLFYCFLSTTATLGTEESGHCREV